MLNTNQIERFMGFVTPEPNSGCWLWLGAATGSGYGQFWLNGKERECAHRTSYKHFVGNIPAGHEVDHICNVRICVNPKHLRPATRQQNAKYRILHQTHCKKGHRFSDENTYVDPRGWRQCRQCQTIATRKHLAKKRRP